MSTPSPSAPEPASTKPRGWIQLPHEHLPAPTFWPSGVALGITFIFWGLITSWVIGGVGLLVFIISLAQWIQDIRREKHDH